MYTRQQCLHSYYINKFSTAVFPFPRDQGELSLITITVFKCILQQNELMTSICTNVVSSSTNLVTSFFIENPKEFFHSVKVKLIKQKMK